MPSGTRLVMQEGELHLEPGTDALAVGDVLEVIRSKGRRKGDLMGAATVTGVDADGIPVLDVLFVQDVADA